MKCFLTLSLLTACTLFAQAPANPPATPKPATPGTLAAGSAANLMTVPPDTLVATIDGKKVTAADLQGVIRGLPQQAQRQALMNATPFLTQYGLFRKLASLAEESKLDQKSPFKEQIEYNRMVTLAQAELAEKQKQLTVTPEELRKEYDGNLDRYTQAKVKVIYIPFSANPPARQDPGARKVMTEAEAKEKAGKVLAEIRGGADFVKMVKEHSEDKNSAAKDGDFGAIRKSDRLPEPIKTAIFALKAGQVSEPVQQPNGYYIFRVEEAGVQPFEDVKLKVSDEIRQGRFNAWVQETQKSVNIKIENQSLFPQATPFPVMPAQPGAPAPSPAKQ